MKFEGIVFVCFFLFSLKSVVTLNFAFLCLYYLHGNIEVFSSLNIE